MRKIGLFLTTVLLILTLALIIYSSGLLPYALPVKKQVQLSKITIPYLNTKEDAEQHTLTATDKLVINGQVGNITIQGAAQDQFHIEVDKRTQSPNPLRATQLLEQIELVINQDQDTTTLEIVFPEKEDREQVFADLTVSVPHNLNLVVQAKLGNLEFINFEGNLQAYTELGGIEVTGFKGNSALESRLGNIRVKNSSFDRELVTLTSLGDLYIQGNLAEKNLFESKLGDLELILSPEQAYVLKGQLDLGSFATQAPFLGQQTKTSVQGIIGSGEQQGEISVILALGSLQVKNKND